MREQVQQLAGAADLIVCDFLTPSLNIPDGLQAPVVLFQHNVEAMIWERHAAIPQNPLRRAYMRLQWQRMLRHEGRECRRFAHVIAVSGADAQLMRRSYGLSSVGEVSTGVDLEYFSAPVSRPQNGRELVFVGSMDWMPNDDGIRWFAGEVFTRLRQQVPDARLTVVGRAPSAAMRELAARDPAIEVTGSVPDVRPYLARAAVSVVPLRIGGGTRLKIYEAMAMGAPVVATSIGAEGLPLRDGEHLLLADSATEQVAALASLLVDRGRAERLAASAQRFVQQHCSWDAVAQTFVQQCPSRPATQQPSYEDQVA
jgi:polysaccharide biosynthesis protein PslH